MTNSVTLTTDQTLAQYGSHQAAIRRIANSPALRLLVITDPENQILESDAATVDIPDPDGTIHAQAATALQEWHRHRGNAGHDIPGITVTELLTGYRREIPTWDWMAI